MEGCAPEREGRTGDYLWIYAENLWGKRIVTFIWFQKSQVFGILEEQGCGGHIKKCAVGFRDYTGL